MGGVIAVKVSFECCGSLRCARPAAAAAGNFSYYYRTADFGVGRFCQMMWRLNFLVIFCCLALNNSYMLYYICPMHTLFTVMVYAGEQNRLFYRNRARKLAFLIPLAAGCCRRR